MEKKEQSSGIEALKKDEDFFHPGFSVDCVILGFYEGAIKILLTKYKGFDCWMLPGSFVLKTENVDNAAYRILKERTGLENVFLRQFYLFGDYNRISMNNENVERVLKELYGVYVPVDHWFSQRFISMGYYALIDISKVNLNKGKDGEEVAWLDLKSDIFYFGDHAKVVNKALDTIRVQSSILPLGKELLPDKFTIPELRTVYETILGRLLDRRNFQRKVLSFGYLEKLEERKRGGAHKAPNLYRFNLPKYEQARSNGIDSSW